MAYYLGIDGGGSKTTCVVGDEALQLSAATGEASNITRVGEVRARKALHEAIRKGCEAAKISPDQIRRACVGVAGAGRQDVQGIVGKIVAEILSGEIEVVGDMEIALTAAFNEGPGVIVISGTGSIAYGRDEHGRTARAGGWGFAMSDEGSAHWIGRTAAAEVMRAIDRARDDRDDDDGDDTHDDRRGDRNGRQSIAGSVPLFGALAAAWNVQTLDEFVRTANAAPDFAASLPGIVANSDAGDKLAQSVLARAGEELAQLAAIVTCRLDRSQTGGGAAIPLAMAGGVFRHCSLVRDVFCNEVRKADQRVSINPQVIEPVAGALQMARRGIKSIKA